MVPGDAQRQRLTPGGLKKKGKIWWNRYLAETVDAETGEISRRVRWLKLGKFRSRRAAEQALKSRLVVERKFSRHQCGRHTERKRHQHA